MNYLSVLICSIFILNFLGCSEDSPQSPLQNKGKLVIKSTPAGARIFLMGTDTGLDTPDTLELIADNYDMFLYLEYFDTAYFSVKVMENLTTTKDITLQDGLPLVEIVLDHINAYAGDSVSFRWTLNQDILMDSIVVTRPINSMPEYKTDRIIYNKRLYSWKDQFGNPIQYFLPPPETGYNFYKKIEGFTYEFHFYGQKAHGVMSSFHLYFNQDL